jgi:hypothetical protein
MEKSLSEKMQDARFGFGLSTLQIGKILGLGANQWRNYENGSVPNKSKKHLIILCMTPRGMFNLLNNSPNLRNEKWYPEFYFKVQGMIFEIESELRRSEQMMNDNYWITHPPITEKIKFNKRKNKNI